MKDSTLGKILQEQIKNITDEKLEKFCNVITQNSDSSVKDLLLEILYENINEGVKGQWYKILYYGHITADAYTATADVNLAKDNYIYGKIVGNAYSSRIFQPWNYMMKLKVLFIDVVNGKPKLMYDDFNINLADLKPNDLDNIEEIIASLNI